ncbi:MAG: hypothetical protein AAFZ58_12495, partial [Pseudomonadota bacterium]
RMLGAQNTGFGSALLAVVVMVIVSKGLETAVSQNIIGLIISAAIGAFIYAGVLGTTFWRGLGISIISTLIQVFTLIVFVSVLVSSGVDLG